jgi:unsaturated rhamnogalacturonyl hydrolase
MVILIQEITDGLALFTFEGNMAMYEVYPDQKYYDYALNWAKLNNWELNGGDTTRLADNQCAGQTYIELYLYDMPIRMKQVRRL